MNREPKKFWCDQMQEAWRVGFVERLQEERQNVDRFEIDGTARLLRFSYCLEFSPTS